MTKLGAFALAGVVAIAGVACTTPFKQAPPAKLMDVYSASPSSDDASSLLGGDWWTSAPTFSVRPLGVDSTIPQVQYEVIRRYENVGTAEKWEVVYTQFDKASSATTYMTNIEDQLGSGSGGKNVGDKVLYYQSKFSASTDSTSNGAPYVSGMFIRVGSLVIRSVWQKSDGFPSSDQVGRVASRLVSGAKDAISGKIRSVAATDQDIALLPPANAFITLLGAVRLPAQALPLMLNIAAPTKLVDLLHSEAVNDFVYGDYALNTDTSMEVQAAVVTFPSASIAEQVFDVFKGAQPVDANGVLWYYLDGGTGPGGQYNFFIVSGRHFALMICRSTSTNEAASRACESPLETVAAAWPSAFSD